MNENQIAQTDSIVAIIQLGRQQRAIARAAEEIHLKLEVSIRNRQCQALLDTLRSAVTAQLPEALHPYVDWDVLCLDERKQEYAIDIDIPECARIVVTFSREQGAWIWNHYYAILVPDHVEYHYEDGYDIHYDRRVETDLPLALAIAADAYPRLQQLVAERLALDAGRIDRMHEDETRMGQEAEEEDQQSQALLRILQADPVLRTFFHAVIAYRNAQTSWDAQLAGQYESMNALERRYENDLTDTRRDAYNANEELLASRARVTELEDQVTRLQATRCD
jgi:hypothetical protein